MVWPATSGERRPLACTGRRLADRIPCNTPSRRPFAASRREPQAGRLRSPDSYETSSLRLSLFPLVPRFNSG
jgi:hypothetical protein